MSKSTHIIISPLKWMSWESLSQKMNSQKSDVWAYCVTCVEILTRQPPYPDINMQSVYFLSNTFLRVPDYLR